VLVPWLGGCGVGSGGDRDDVRQVVSSYLSASAQGNGRRACAFLVPALRREMAREARRGGMRGCPELLGTRIRYRLASLPVDLRADVGDALSDRDQIDVETRGDDRAVARLEMPHHALAEARFDLVRTQQGWRIARVGG
jgi:hypothetical protein